MNVNERQVTKNVFFQKEITYFVISIISPSYMRRAPLRAECTRPSLY